MKNVEAVRAAFERQSRAVCEHYAPVGAENGFDAFILELLNRRQSVSEARDDAHVSENVEEGLLAVVHEHGHVADAHARAYFARLCRPLVRLVRGAHVLHIVCKWVDELRASRIDDDSYGMDARV